MTCFKVYNFYVNYFCRTAICLPLLHYSISIPEQLFEYSRHGYLKEVIGLLKIGACTNWSNSEGYTALHIACLNNRKYIMKVLMRNHSNINQQDNFGNTPLHHACKEGHIECVKLLVAMEKCDLS